MRNTTSNAAPFGTAMVATAAILWGGWALVLRPAGLPPLASALVVLVTLSLPAPWVVRREALRDRGATLALLLLALADAGNIVLYFGALERGPIAVAVLTHYLAPALVALSAPAVLGEARSRRALVAAPLSLLGLALLVGGARAGLPLATAALGTASAFFYAAIVFSAKRASRAYSPMAVTALHALLSAAALVILFGRRALPPMGIPVVRVAAGTLLCGIVSSLLFYGGLRRISTQVASALTYLEPLAAAGVGYVVFHEALAPSGLAGAALILASGLWVALETAPAAPPAPRHPAIQA